MTVESAAIGDCVVAIAEELEVELRQEDVESKVDGCRSCAGRTLEQQRPWRSY